MIRVRVDENPERLIGYYDNWEAALQGVNAWIAAESESLPDDVEEPPMGWPQIIGRDEVTGKEKVLVDDHVNFWEDYS